VEKPNLAGQKSIYIREQLTALRSGKRKHPEMKIIARDLTDRKIAQPVVYLCVPKIRFCNIDGEGHQGQVVR
jgi:cytochrome c553